MIISDPPRPGTPEWRRIVSASKVPAILGLSRWQSPLSMWLEMHGDVTPEEPAAKTERFLWGHVAELSLAEYWKAKNPGWYLNKPHNGVTEITYKAEGLPFEAIATIDRRALSRHYSPRSKDPARFHIIECKLAADLDTWGRPGEPDSVPADYFAQVQFQMGVSGIPAASIVVLGPFGNPEIHEVEFDDELFKGIVARVAEFVDTLDQGTPPPLDDHPATYEAVRRVHPEIDRDKVVEVDHGLAVEVAEAARLVDEAKRRETAAKTRLAALMADARLAEYQGVKVADRRLVGRAESPSVVINKKFII